MKSVKQASQHQVPGVAALGDVSIRARALRGLAVCCSLEPVKVVCCSYWFRKHRSSDHSSCFWVPENGRKPTPGIVMLHGPAGASSHRHALHGVARWGHASTSAVAVIALGIGLAG